MVVLVALSLQGLLILAQVVEAEELVELVRPPATQ